jgi:hypothetical protein
MDVDLASSGLEGAIANGAHWLWGTDRAIVLFDLLINGSLDDAGYEVAIPYSTLRRFMRPDAPVR